MQFFKILARNGCELVFMSVDVTESVFVAENHLRFAVSVPRSLSVLQDKFFRVEERVRIALHL